jgi:1,4-dihydroxy-2-naphthoate octaprenyltransferase
VSVTTASEWVQGARPRTLGAAVAPVLVGTAAAVADADGVIWWRFAFAMVVAIALQVGVNYANDYSDGVRGTDKERKGPLRLTATGTATPSAVKRAAASSFLVAAVFGAVLSIVVNPWLLLVGVAAIAAAVLYTGGPKPYGYIGLGEIMVLVFFGFVATIGSAYVQTEYVPGAAWWGSLVVGLLACAILLANNIRDIATDSVTGKHTLAVRVGATATKRLFVACYVGSFVSVLAIGITQPWALLGLLALPLAVTPVRTMFTRSDPPALISVLVATSRLEVVLAVLVSVGLCLS